LAAEMILKQLADAVLGLVSADVVAGAGV